MKGSRTRLRKVLPEREREEATVSGSDRAPNFQGSAGRQRNPVRGLAQLASLWLPRNQALLEPLLFRSPAGHRRALNDRAGCTNPVWAGIGVAIGIHLNF